MDTGTQGPVSAPTMADIEAFVSARTTCTDLHMEDRDSDHEDDPEAESAGKLWGIKERAVCWDAKRMGVTLMSVDDMKSFQTQARRQSADWYLLGRTSPSPVAPRRRPTSGGPGSSPSSATRRPRSPAATRRRRASWTVAH